MLYITFYFTRDARQPLSQIRLSLAVALGAGQIIFLTGINATENKVGGFTVLYNIFKDIIIEQNMKITTYVAVFVSSLCRLCVSQ